MSNRTQWETERLYILLKERRCNAYQSLVACASSPFFYPLIILLSSKISFMTNLDNGCINDLTFPSSEESGEVLLSSAYFAPIQWYQKLNRYSSCLIEQHDNFIKQTYRNRCVIASANGPQALSIPVEKYEGAKCPMKDVRISDHDNWRHQHWNALQIYALFSSGSGSFSMTSTGR